MLIHAESDTIQRHSHLDDSLELIITMLERGNYDARALAVFDTIGAYFVDVMYNNLYTLSRDLVQRGGASNITDAYRGMIVNYMNGVASRDDCFKKVVYSLHEYYQTHQRFSSLLSGFQDKVLSQFIPPEYYQDFTDKHKDKTLRDVINVTVTELGTAVIDPMMLRRIIDNHFDYANVEELRTVVTNSLIMQREEYYTKFATERTKQRNKSVTIDRGIIKKLKQAYVEEKRKACDLAADKDRAINMIRQLMARVDELEARIKALTAAASGAPVLPTPVGEEDTRGRARKPISPARTRRHVHVPARTGAPTVASDGVATPKIAHDGARVPKIASDGGVITRTPPDGVVTPKIASDSTAVPRIPADNVDVPETTPPSADDIVNTIEELIGADEPSTSAIDAADDSDMDEDEIHRRQREAANRWAIGGDPWTVDAV